MLEGRGRWWTVISTVGSAADLHNREIPATVDRLVWSHQVEKQALVVGSAQPDSDLSAPLPPDLEVVRRHSGGGAVLVDPADTWIDLLIGADDRLWTDDVGRAFHWLGEVWLRALGSLGVAATMHTGRLVDRDESRVVCFAGVGPGELQSPDGVKLLGLSQRRTRTAARFQCLVPYRTTLGPTLKRLNPAVVPSSVDPGTEIGAALDSSVLTTTFLAELARLQ